MIDLDTRQIATLIWVVVIIMTLILWPRTRRAVWPALREVFRAMLTWRVFVSLIAYFTYAAAALFATSKFVFWHEYPLTDAILIVTFVGLPILFSLGDKQDGEQLIKKVLRQTLGISALMVFLVGLSPLALTGELILQSILGLLILSSLAVGRYKKHKRVKNSIDVVIGIIILWLIVRVLAVATSSWSREDFYGALDELVLSIILPTLLLPFVYIFALIIRYETVFTVSRNFNNSKKMSMPAKMACLTGINIQLGPLNSLGGIWLQKLNEAPDLREALSITSSLKRAYREQRYKNKIRNKRLRNMKGVIGVDENGLQLDRREFYESKHDLESLLYMQMGQFRNVHRHYNSEFPVEIAVSKLAKNHDITMKVRSDKKAWYAWRQMPNGYYFGVGGSPSVDEVWLYESTSRPDSFPSKNHKSWHESSGGPKPPEWQFDDSPPQIKVPEYYLNT